MKLSVLAKATSVGIISFSLAMLPMLLPISAQTSTTSTGSNTGSGNTSDPNINPTTSNSTTTTSGATGSGTNESSGNMTTGATTAPSSSTSGNSTNSGTSSTGAGSAPSDTTTGAGSAPSATSGDGAAPSSSSTGGSSTSSQSNTSTTPEQTTSTRGSSSSLGWLGLLGLIGLASLFRKPAKASANNQHLRTRLNAANDHLEQGAAQAGEGLSNFIGELKTDVDDFKERRAKAKEIKQIKNALGRPSNRVILDRQDNVVLNVGDLITNQAIERARSADMLDVLLDSVDEQTPAIDDEERSAPAPGEASLEEQDGTTISNHRL